MFSGGSPLRCMRNRVDTGSGGRVLAEMLLLFLL